MRYYKSTEDNVVLCISTVDGEGNGNITDLEYITLKDMITSLPAGKCIRDNSDGTYEYEDAPPMPEPEPTDDDFSEAGRIMMGVK